MFHNYDLQCAVATQTKHKQIILMVKSTNGYTILTEKTDLYVQTYAVLNIYQMNVLNAVNTPTVYLSPLFYLAKANSKGRGHVHECGLLAVFIFTFIHWIWDRRHSC